ncbi:MAG: glycosyltransferase family 2 protein, partial [Pseudomonadota bacterium]
LAAIAALAAIGVYGVSVLLLYPAQAARLAAREGPPWRTAIERASFLTLAKVPEAMGAIAYVFRRLRGGRSGLIEYK